MEAPRVDRVAPDNLLPVPLLGRADPLAGIRHH